MTSLRSRLSLSRYADLLAAILDAPVAHLPALTESFGLSCDDWRRVDAAWTASLTCPGMPGDGELARDFAVAFMRARTHLRRARAVKTLDASAAEPPLVPGPGSGEHAQPVGGRAAHSSPKTQALPAFSWPAPAGAPRPATDRGGDQTMELHLVDAPAELLPFLGQTDVDADFVASMERDRLRRAAEPRDDEMDETAAPGLPVPSPAAQLTVEQYASLCAEMAADPSQATATLARYRIATWEQHRALAERYAALFREDRALQMRWALGVRRYGDWLQSRGRDKRAGSERP